MLLFNKLILFFNKKEVYIGYSIEELSKIVNSLMENDIKYEKKVIKLLRSDERFSLRRIGVNMDRETQYTISVRESDYERAKYIVNKVLHP